MLLSAPMVDHWPDDEPIAEANEIYRDWSIVWNTYSISDLRPADGSPSSNRRTLVRPDAATIGL